MNHLFRNKSNVYSTIAIIISIIFIFNGSGAAGGILIFFVLFYKVGCHLVNDHKKKNQKSREAEFNKFIKRTGDSYLNTFNDPIDEGLQCFYKMDNPRFYNVIEKEVDNARLYIGELEWNDPIEYSDDGTMVSNLLDKAAASQKIIKYYTTMCVIYDKGFRLPNFDLYRETFGIKVAEKMNLNTSLDIDFDEDKAFSDAWWLSTNETIVVKDLFDKNIRANFMKFVNRDYRITGQLDLLIILTSKVLLPTEYYKVISDMKAIHRILKTSKKFYKAPKQTY